MSHMLNTQEDKEIFWNGIKYKIYPWVKQSLYDSDLISSKHIKVQGTPLISFIGDLLIVFVIDRGESFELFQDNMLPEHTSIEQLYHIACENLVKHTDFVISQTNYGGYGIIADGHHEASSLCFKHIWDVCVDKLQEDIIISAPTKDMVLFIPANDAEKLEEMIQMTKEAYRRGTNKITDQLFLFSKKNRELQVYEP